MDNIMERVATIGATVAVATERDINPSDNSNAMEMAVAGSTCVRDAFV